MNTVIQSRLASRRNVLFGLLAAGVGIGATACSRPSGTPGATGGTPQGILSWATPAQAGPETEAFRQVANLVKAAAPGLEVNLDAAYATNYYDTLVTRTVAGRGPDLMTCQSTMLPSLVNRGLLTPLADLPTNPENSADGKYSKNTIAAMSFDGKQYLMPYDIGPCFLWYNKDLLASKGIAEPSPTKAMSHAEFLAIGDALKDGGNTFLYSSPPAFDYITPWLWSAGGEFLSEDRKTWLLGTDASVAAMEDFIALYRNGYAKPITDLTSTNAIADFASGKIGFTPGGPWDSQYLRDQKLRFQWGFTPIPSGTGGSATWVAGSGIGVAAKSNNAAGGARALEILSNLDAQKILASSGRAYPARSDAVQFYGGPDTLPKNVAAIETIIADPTTRPYLTTPAWQQIQTVLARDLMTALLPGGDTAKQIKIVQPQCQQLIAKS